MSDHNDTNRPKPRVRKRLPRQHDKTQDREPGVNGGPVGYGNPPAKSTWKKGKPSPNPKGRPRKAKNYKTVLQEILDSEIAIREADGRSRRVSVRRAYLMKLTEKALKGEIRPAEVLLRLEGLMLDAAEQEQAQGEGTGRKTLDIPDDFLDEYFLQRTRSEKRKEAKE